MSQLADLHARYLAERGHNLSTAGLPFIDAVRGQASYVSDEADELCDAILSIRECCAKPEALCAGTLRHARHELADVVLSAVTLAKILGVTVEGCIAEKTAADRGRG